MIKQRLRRIRKPEGWLLNPFVRLERVRVDAPRRDNLSALRFEFYARASFERVNNLQPGGLCHEHMKPAASRFNAREVVCIESDIFAKLREAFRSAVARINVYDKLLFGEPDANVAVLVDATREHLRGVVRSRRPIRIERRFADFANPALLVRLGGAIAVQRNEREFRAIGFEGLRVDDARRLERLIHSAPSKSACRPCRA